MRGSVSRHTDDWCLCACFVCGQQVTILTRVYTPTTHKYDQTIAHSEASLAIRFEDKCFAMEFLYA